VDRKQRRFTISVGPLGMSLAAAAITAVAFAAISLADSGNGGNGGTGVTGGGGKSELFEAPGPPRAGMGIATFRGDLSAVDRQKMEEFRRCMQDNGAPAPPDPGEFDPDNPPKPPGAADREKLQRAWEACKDKLPEDQQTAGPPQLHPGGCAPPPGAPGESGKSHDQSNGSSGSSSGSDS